MEGGESTMMAKMNFPIVSQPGFIPAGGTSGFRPLQQYTMLRDEDRRKP